MKRILIVLVTLVAMVAFVSGAVAQEKKAAAPAPAAPAAEKAKADKPKAPKAMSFKGTIAAYEAGKMIKVKGSKEKEMTFDIAADAKIKGEAKEGAKVTVGYKKDGDKMVATSISAAAAKKPKAAKKEVKEEKK